MGITTFSVEGDAADLAYADALTYRQFRMPFAQYCGTVLIEAVRQGAELPAPSGFSAADRKARAIGKLKNLAYRSHDAAIGAMPDSAIDDLIASRYA